MRDAYDLALAMAANERLEKHDAAREAILETAVTSNVVACREPEKHFKCHNGTGDTVTPGGVLILQDGTVVGLDVCYTATPASGVCITMIYEERWGRDTAVRRATAWEERAEVFARERVVCQAGEISARELHDHKFHAALRVESAQHKQSSNVKPLELGGAEFLCVCLSYFEGWRSSTKKDFIGRISHTGDDEDYLSYAGRFDHPTKT